MAQVQWGLYFDYRPDTGNISWKSRSPVTSRLKGWNKQFAGTVAGTPITHRGVRKCVKVTIFGRCILVHRIIWEMHFGVVPADMLIDHKDRDPWNNRLDNLRLATRSQNSANRKIDSRNKTGYKGVCFIPALMKYGAGIRVHGKQIYLGVFSNAEDAATAYHKAASKYFGEFSSTQHIN